MRFQQITKTNQNDHERAPQNHFQQVLSSYPFVSPLLQFQRALGNQAFGHFVQAKLQIGKPGDIYEQEADRVAEMVMHTPEPSAQKQTEEDEEEPIQTNPLAAQTTLLIQKQVDEDDKEKEEEAPLQTKEASSSLPEISPQLESQVQSIKGAGQPLSESVRAFFEPRFGQHFNRIRIHTGDSAEKLASALNAHAFTFGDDIIFGSGQYAPLSHSGRKLLSHELTHTIQQKNKLRMISRSPNSENEKKEEPAKEKSKLKLTWTWKDMAEYPLLVDIWKDIFGKGLTVEERKKLALKGHEASAFYAWALAIGFPFLGLGETYDKEAGIGDALDKYYKYAKELGTLSPSSDIILDPLSRLAGIRIEDYFSSDQFKAQLAKHAASIATLVPVIYGAYYGYQTIKSATAEKGEFEPAEWTKHVAGIPLVMGLIFKKYLKAPDFFNVAPLQLKTHPAFNYQPFSSGGPPEGLTLEGSQGKEEPGKETKLSLTLNLPKLISLFSEGEFSADDMDNLEKYRGWQTSLWFAYEDIDPTETMAKAGKIPEMKLKGGTLFGAKGHLGFLEVGMKKAGEDSQKLTTWFIKGGYGYSWKNHKFLKKIGFTATYTDYNEVNIAAPGAAPGTPISGKATQVTPFAKVEFGSRHKVGIGTALSFVTGSKEVFDVSQWRADLSYTYMGDRSPDQLPIFKLDLSGSIHRLDWWDPNSPLLWGVEAKAIYDKFFGGVRVMGGAGGIPESRAAQIGDSITVRVPTGLLITGGYNF